MADRARESALKILNTLDQKTITLDTVMDDFTQYDKGLSKLDLSLVNALVYGVLRWRGSLDYIIDQFSKTPLKKINPEVLNILRLGVFQLKYMSRIPDSAAVNTSVNLAKTSSPPWVIKYVNGLLRNVGRNLDAIAFPELSKNKTIAIAAEKSFPTWLAQRWLDRFGLEETLRLCDTINSIPEITIRVNTLKTNRDKVLESIQAHVSDISVTDFSPYGVSFFRPETSIQEFQAFRDGWFQVQDEAAQLVSMVLSPKPGERVLDACAGLGGKTGHIAQLMNNQGEILAVDSDINKLKRLESEMTRLGVSTVKTSVVDLGTPLDEKKLGVFDRILVDAPCSGMGVIRRNPDSKWSLSKKNLNRYKKRQIGFLDNLAALVKPSGTIVYAVCSSEPEENEAVINSFLHKHPEFDINSSELSECSLTELTNKKGYITTFPHIHGMDGFFCVSLKRNG